MARAARDRAPVMDALVTMLVAMPAAGSAVATVLVAMPTLVVAVPTVMAAVPTVMAAVPTTVIVVRRGPVAFVIVAMPVVPHVTIVAIWLMPNGGAIGPIVPANVIVVPA